ncbi:hypothetical protein EAF00_012048 [Botryotinia globosa]|nr:hypothetical protein EAF00_012048 [Botryotinia globosa]
MICSISLGGLFLLGGLLCDHGPLVHHRIASHYEILSVAGTDFEDLKGHLTLMVDESEIRSISIAPAIIQAMIFKLEPGAPTLLLATIITAPETLRPIFLGLALASAELANLAGSCKNTYGYGSLTMNKIPTPCHSA